MKRNTPLNPLLIEGNVFDIPELTQEERNEVYWAVCELVKNRLEKESSYRIRVGDYRVVYQVNTKKKLIIIYHIRHRKDVYRG